jgi:N-acetylglucosamine kinase-like BadF-type ATPase
VACLGLAGFDRPEDRHVLRAWSAGGGWADRLVLVNDGDLVVAAGTPEGWGVGVIAGTGSIAVGRAPDGRTARAGGWGYLFGDEGSAYAVAVAALRRVARRADGRDPPRTDPDPLTVHLCRALDLPGPGHLVSALYAPGVDRSRVAALAPAVVAAAAEDAALAREILGPAGSDLADMVRAGGAGAGVGQGACSRWRWPAGSCSRRRRSPDPCSTTSGPRVTTPSRPPSPSRPSARSSWPTGRWGAS